MRRFGGWLAVVGMVAMAPRSAGAEPRPAASQAAPPTDEARALYDRGAAAYEAGDHAAAARDFAAADQIAPNAVALAAAIDAATLAGDAVLAMTLVDRAAGRPADAQVAAAVKVAQAKLAGTTGTVKVTCGGSCEVTLDGEAMAAGTPRRAKIGAHVVVIRGGGRAAEEHRVSVGPDAKVEVAARLVTEGGGEGSSGASPVWFFVGLGVTALTGAGTIASGADTASKHEAFLRAGCAGPSHGDCAGLAGDGKAAELRTNVLAGVTAGLAAASAVVGLTVVRWSSPKGSQVAVGLAGPGLVVRGAL